MPAAMSLEGGEVRIGSDPRHLGAFSLDAGSPSKAGMKFSSQVTLTPPACTELLYAQNIIPFREVVYKDGSRNRLEVSGWILDTSFPAPCALNEKQDAVTTEDSPGQPFPSPDAAFISTIEARDQFRMFLRIHLPQGKWQTLQIGSWSWVGLLRNDNPNLGEGFLKKDDGISRVIPSTGRGITNTSEDPVLGPNFLSLRFATDRSANASPQSLAAIHLDDLNRLFGGSRPGGNVCPPLGP